MLKETAQRTLRRLGYELRRVEPTGRTQSPSRPVAPPPPPLQPTWPLPIRGEPRTEEGIRAAFNSSLWPYAYSFNGGLDFGLRHNTPHELSDDPARPLQRFRHVMPSHVRRAAARCVGARRGGLLVDAGDEEMGRRARASSRALCLPHVAAAPPRGPDRSVACHRLAGARSALLGIGDGRLSAGASGARARLRSGASRSFGAGADPGNVRRAGNLRRQDVGARVGTFGVNRSGLRTGGHGEGSSRFRQIP
jgi:hypothetical protein